jgi:phage tail-like protein
MSAAPNFFYLNLENTWPHFRLTEMVIRQDGALILAQVPMAAAVITELPPPAQPFTGAASLGGDRQGNLYIADPARDRLLRWDACNQQVQELPCFQGNGTSVEPLRSPRGVLAGPRQALYLADSGNHRVLVVDLITGQIRSIWGQPGSAPEPGDAPGRFNDPWDVVADRADNLYVLDHGNQRVQKISASGRVAPEFWQKLSAQSLAPTEPTYLTVTRQEGQERLALIDQGRGQIIIYGLDGTLDSQATEQLGSVTGKHLAGLVFAENALYVGDGENNRVLAYDLNGKFIGEAKGYQGPVAGLGQDCQGRLLVHPGGSGPVTRLLPDQGSVEQGTFLAGPFDAGNRPTRWHRLRVAAAALPPGCHVQLFSYVSDTATPPPDFSLLPAKVPGMNLTPVNTWRAAPVDSLDFLVLHEPAPFLWLAGKLRSAGTGSPALEQMRLEYNHDSWLRYLPAIYRGDETNAGFLARMLALLESLLLDDEDLIQDLPRLFDPGAAPAADSPGSWLDWLAGWLDFQLEGTWSAEAKRQALAEAFSLHRRRGTIPGLRRLIQLYTGAAARIEEPARFASLWCLEETSTLGFNTMVAPAQAQGAVVGTSAILSQSHLITAADYGAPLFEDVAHLFCVQVYAADLANPATDARIRQILDQEKPAHTVYHLCPIQPRMRVGFQARLGLDTIVGGPAPNLALGEPHLLGLDSVLSGKAAGRPDQGTLGQGARIGQSSRLT